MATRWGILSAGKISHDFVVCIRNILSEGHELVAVASRDLQSSQQFAERHQISKAYGSYEELAKDADVEIVYIGNLNPHHYSVAKMMLEAGKHVLCEKPMCMNLTQTQRLIACAKKHKRFLMEGIWSRCFPVYEQLRTELREKTIGKPQIVQVRLGIPITSFDRIRLRDLGGGASLDIGIYTVQFASLVFGGEKPIRITATGFLNEEGVDETVTVILCYSDNRMAILTFTAKIKLPNEALIVGTTGVLKVSDPFWCPSQLIAPTKMYYFQLPNIDSPVNYTNSEGLTYEIREIRKCLQKGLLESPVLPLAESEVISFILTEIQKQLEVTYPPAILD